KNIPDNSIEPHSSLINPYIISNNANSISINIKICLLVTSYSINSSLSKENIVSSSFIKLFAGYFSNFLAYLKIQYIPIMLKTMNIPILNGVLEYIGTPAILWATTIVNGFIIAAANPKLLPNSIIAKPNIAS